MNLRATGWLALATLALASWVAWLELGGGATRGTTGPLFPGLAPEAVQSIAWVREDARFRAVRSADGWRVVEPILAPGDAATLDTVARGIAALSSAGAVEEPAAAGVYGLAETGTRIVFVADGREQGFTLGDQTPLGGAAYASADALESAVLLVPVQQAALLDRDLDGVRDRRVLDLDPAAVSRARFAARSEAGGFDATLERAEDGWRIVAPAALAADDAAVERWLSDLSLLRAERFVDEAGPRERDALASPAFAAELEGPDGVRELALAAPAADDSLRLARGRDGQVFAVRAALVAHLPARLFDLRAKTVARFDPAHASALELEAEGRVETLAPPPAELLAVLASLDATGVAADALGEAESAALGLAPPRLRVRVAGAPGETLAELDFGRSDAARGLVVRAVGRETVWLVDAGLNAKLQAARRSR